jgi:murein DD-endopeptidase MepM/ murein hydrolase activator NlpD
LRADSDLAMFTIGHCSKIIAPMGTHVTKGQIIALSGHTGATEPYVYLLFQPHGVANTDPKTDPQQRWRSIV